jgi:hypothetical protein
MSHLYILDISQRVNNVVDAMIATVILSGLSMALSALGKIIRSKNARVAKVVAVITNAKIRILVDVAMVAFNGWWLYKLVRLTSSVTHLEVMAIVTFLGLGAVWLNRLIRHSIDLAVD